MTMDKSKQPIENSIHEERLTIYWGKIQIILNSFCIVVCFLGYFFIN